jgi:hypothetical protein
MKVPEEFARNADYQEFKQEVGSAIMKGERRPHYRRTGDPTDKGRYSRKKVPGKLMQYSGILPNTSAADVATHVGARHCNEHLVYRDDT